MAPPHMVSLKKGVIVKPIIFLAAVLLSCLVCTLHLNSKVDAAYSDLPIALPTDVPGGGNHDLLMSTVDEDTTSGLRNQDFRFLIHTPASDPANSIQIRTTTVVDNNLMPNCEDFRTGGPGSPLNIRAFRGNEGENFNITSPPLTFSSCEDRGPGWFILYGIEDLVSPATANSERFPGYKVLLVSMRIKESRFKYFDVIRNSKEVRVSYAGDNSPYAPFSGPAVSLVDSPGGYGTITMGFGASCNYSGSATRYVRWYDADSNAGQDNNVTYQIQRKKDGGNWYNDGPIKSAGDGYQQEAISGIEAAEKFRIQFFNVRARNHPSGNPNNIKVVLPFDQAAYYQDCSSPGGGTSVGSVGCDAVSFTVPSDGKTHRYRVYVNDGSSPGNPVDSNGDGDPYNDNVDYGGTVGSGGTVNFNLVNDRKIKSGMLWYTRVIYNHDTVASGIQSQQTSSVGPCYTASCSITVQGDLGGNRSSAGGSFSVRVRITNTGVNDLPERLGNDRLAATIAKDGKWGNPDGVEWGNLAPAFMGAGINKNGYRDRWITLTAPNDRAVHNITAYPDYWGRWGIGSCDPASVVTYQRYDFDATVSSSLNDRESPTAATLSSGLVQRGVDVDGTSTRSFFKRRNAANTPLPGFAGTQMPNPDARNFGNVSYNDTYAIPANSFTLGDSYCVAISLDRGHGWRGPSDYLNEGSTAANNCDPATSPGACPPGSVCTPGQTVVNNPYFKAYSGDVVAGGGFGTNCGRTNSGILGFLRPLSEHNDVANRSGSGGQLGAFALGSINGFTSASTRTVAPAASGWKGLTFGNDNNSAASTTAFDPFLGGNMSGDGWCVPDYFGSTQYPDSSGVKDVSTATSDINVNSLADNRQTLRNVNGQKLRLIGNGGPSYARHHTVYVDGDVFILNNIVYRTDYSGGIGTIPSFTLVVKGNIYVDNDVTQLDGLYIAQPADGRANTGRIYTCAREEIGNAPVVDGSGMFGHCGAANNSSPSRQLTVNGAFIAEKVVLNRAGKSLRDSRFRELPGSTAAAEVFNFSQEMYLSPPFFRPIGTATSGDYDYLGILAPIL